MHFLINYFAFCFSLIFATSYLYLFCLHVYFVDTLVFLFHAKFAPYDFALGFFSIGSSTKQGQPFFSQKAIASSLFMKSKSIFDNGSPLVHKKILSCVPKTRIIYTIFSTHLELQPIKGFSHRSRVSNSIFQRFVLLVPDCIAFFAGLKILTRRDFTCSSGIPVTGAMSSYNLKYNHNICILLPSRYDYEVSTTKTCDIFGVGHRLYIETGVYKA